MFKKFLSVLLAVLMIASVIAVGVASTGAATSSGFTPDPNKLYFDVDGATNTAGDTWSSLMGTKGKIAFYIFGGDLDTPENSTQPIAWGGKKAQGTATQGETGIYEFAPASKLGTLTPGVQYKIIFVRVDGNNWTDQTYDLFFTTDCLGKVAYCDGSFTENPVDSSKKAATAYWRDMDPKVNGPVLSVSSIGNVVGSCPEQGKDEYDVFVDFITVVGDKTNVTQLANARKYVCEISPTLADGSPNPSYKTEQKLIDDIGESLGLTKDQIKQAFDENPLDKGLVVTPETDPPTYTQEPAPVTTAWSYDASTLPAGTTPTEAPTDPPHVHTPGEAQIENVTPATCVDPGKHDVIVKCTECGEKIEDQCQYDVVDNPTGIHTPGQPENEVVKPATCGEDGSHNVIVKCSVCQQKIEDQCQYGVVDPATGEHTPGLPDNEIVKPATCGEDGSHNVIVKCTVCQQIIEDQCQYGVVDPATGEHTPGQPESEVVKAATCGEDGSHNVIVKCTVCGQNIEDMCEYGVVDQATGEHKTPLKEVAEVPATATSDGVKAHFECEICGMKFTDGTGAVEATDEYLRIPAENIQGDADGNGEVESVDATAIQRFVIDIEVPGFKEFPADADGDKLVDIIDATLIQRVLADITSFDAWNEKHPNKWVAKD